LSWRRKCRADGYASSGVIIATSDTQVAQLYVQFAKAVVGGEPVWLGVVYAAPSGCASVISSAFSHVHGDCEGVGIAVARRRTNGLSAAEFGSRLHGGDVALAGESASVPRQEEQQVAASASRAGTFATSSAGPSWRCAVLACSC